MSKPFAGHTVLATMLHSNVLQDVINSYFRSGIFPDFHLNEECSYIWWRERGRHALESGDAATAAEYLETSLHLQYNFGAAQLLLRALVKVRSFERAQEVLTDVAREEEGVGRLPGNLVALIEKHSHRTGKDAPNKGREPIENAAKREAFLNEWLRKLSSWISRRIS